MPKVTGLVNKRKLGKIETNFLSFFLKRWIESPRKAVPIIKINSLIPHTDKKATTKHVEVATSKDVKKAIPALAKLAGNIGDAQVRNRGTIGGSISNNDPSACYPSACMALNAVIHTNSRKIPAAKFFTGMFETALKKGELVEAVEFEVPEKADYQKHPNPASRYAIIGVFVAKHKKEVKVAVTGAKSSVYIDKDLSQKLTSSFSSSAIQGIELDHTEMNSDMHASSEYRANLVSLYAKKAVEAC